MESSNPEFFFSVGQIWRVFFSWVSFSGFPNTFIPHSLFAAVYFRSFGCKQIIFGTLFMIITKYQSITGTSVQQSWETYDSNMKLRWNTQRTICNHEWQPLFNFKFPLFFFGFKQVIFFFFYLISQNILPHQSPRISSLHSGAGKTAKMESRFSFLVC